MSYSHLCFLLIYILAQPSFCQTLPEGFSQKMFVDGLQDPDVMAFAPDGRLFIGERILGKVRVVTPQGNMLPDDYVTLDVPPERHRSSGIRGMTFHPDYPTTPYIYFYYMQDNPRFNRVSRFTTDPANQNKAQAGSEVVLIEIPANSTGATGSHNGGALIFGEDNKLYITTGDGWEAWDSWSAGDPVQSLSSLTGKLLRINDDGSIPQDNPFYTETTGDYRAIYALGFRNPYTISLHHGTGDLYVADVEGNAKDAIKKIIPGGNYQYEHNGTFNPNIGISQSSWVNSGANIISGGVWFTGTAFPEQYRGSYFATGWGSRNIINITSDADNSKSTFATGISGNGGPPVYIIQGPVDGNLYWLSTNYETNNGEVMMISHESNTGRAENRVEMAELKLRVFPSSGELRIQIMENDIKPARGFNQITITNIRGESILRTYLKKSISILKIPTPSRGVYLVELRIKDSNLRHIIVIP